MDINEIKRRLSSIKCNHNQIHPKFSLEHFPHCRFEEFRQTKKCAVLILIFKSKLKTNDELSVLFTIRNKNLKSFPGEICFPGGKFDSQDVNFIDTALREANEEIKIDRNSIDFVTQLCPVISPIGHYIVPIIGLINNENIDEILESLQANTAEVASIFWVPLKYFAESFKNDELFQQIVAPISEHPQVNIPNQIIRNIFHVNDMYLNTKYSNIDETYVNKNYVYGFNSQMIIICTLVLVDNVEFECCIYGKFNRKNILDYMRLMTLATYFYFKSEVKKKLKNSKSKL